MTIACYPRMATEIIGRILPILLGEGNPMRFATVATRPIARDGKSGIRIAVNTNDQGLREGKAEVATQIEIGKIMCPHAVSEAVAVLHIMEHHQIEMSFSKDCHWILHRKTLAAPFLSHNGLYTIIAQLSPKCLLKE